MLAEKNGNALISLIAVWKRPPAWVALRETGAVGLTANPNPTLFLRAAAQFGVNAGPANVR
jgi:hypothetical protein